MGAMISPSSKIRANNKVTNGHCCNNEASSSHSQSQVVVSTVTVSDSDGASNSSNNAQSSKVISAASANKQTSVFKSLSTKLRSGFRQESTMNSCSTRSKPKQSVKCSKSTSKIDVSWTKELDRPDASDSKGRSQVAGVQNSFSASTSMFAMNSGRRLSLTASSHQSGSVALSDVTNVLSSAAGDTDKCTSSSEDQRLQRGVTLGRSGCFTDVEVTNDLDQAGKDPGTRALRRLSRPDVNGNAANRATTSEGRILGSLGSHDDEFSSQLFDQNGNSSAYDVIRAGSKKTTSQHRLLDDLISTTTRRDSSSRNRGGFASIVKRVAPATSTLHTTFDNSQSRKTVIQASTGELMHCLSEFLRHRCSRIKHWAEPEEAAVWMRNVDRSLFTLGWQDVGFINPANVVFVYLLLRDQVEETSVCSVLELQALMCTCLYVAYSYMGHEISYPLKPFIVDEDRSVFWTRCLALINRMSGKMLRLNKDPSYFTEVFAELKSFGSSVA